MPEPARRIAVILEGRVQYERNVLRGVRDYVAGAGEWLIRLEFPGSQTLRLLRSWKPDGVLFQSAGLSSSTLARLVEMQPAIHLSESPPRWQFRSVGLDNEAIGKAAAEYFLERRFSRFAFVGTGGKGFSRNRGGSFRQHLEERGFPVAVLEDGADRTEDELLPWLHQLPTPCALLATHDVAALHLATVCRGAGIRVPDDIALLGVDDDRLLCELAWPQISSVAVPSRRVGYEAARRLDLLLRGGEDEIGENLLLPPTGIVTRQSSDVNQTEDEVVNSALRYMRSHLSSGINVDDVTRETGVSRRLLERKFSAQRGRSPLRELRRLRMEKARSLLLETSRPLHEIASACGCRDASHLVSVFRRECGTTPGRYRAENGTGNSPLH